MNQQGFVQEAANERLFERGDICGAYRIERWMASGGVDEVTKQRVRP
jgi:hypothetical protein